MSHTSSSAESSGEQPLELPADRTFYVLRVKGKAKIPDYLQIRDSEFTLIGYFRPGRELRSNKATGGKQALFRVIESLCQEIPYSQVTRVVVPEEQMPVDQEADSQDAGS